MTEYTEEDFLNISGIQHFKFCKRQWALINIECQWAKNQHTVLGDLMHKKVHNPFRFEKRKDILAVCSLPVSSKKMGVSGQCDVVEFHKSEDGVKLFGHRGTYSIFPIEYKKGKPKKGEEDILQVAAQTLCLEEMFSVEIPYGAIFYGETNKRQIVNFNNELRQQVREVFKEMHRYYDRRYTPKTRRKKECNGCSLKDLCLPKLDGIKTVNSYLESAIKD